MLKKNFLFIGMLFAINMINQKTSYAVEKNINKKDLTFYQQQDHLQKLLDNYKEKDDYKENENKSKVAEELLQKEKEKILKSPGVLQKLRAYGEMYGIKNVKKILLWTLLIGGGAVTYSYYQDPSQWPYMQSVLNDLMAKISPQSEMTFSKDSTEGDQDFLQTLSARVSHVSNMLPNVSMKDLMTLPNRTQQLIIAGLFPATGMFNILKNKIFPSSDTGENIKFPDRKDEILDIFDNKSQKNNAEYQENDSKNISDNQKSQEKEQLSQKEESLWETMNKKYDEKMSDTHQSIYNFFS